MEASPLLTPIPADRASNAPTDLASGASQALGIDLICLTPSHPLVLLLSHALYRLLYPLFFSLRSFLLYSRKLWSKTAQTLKTSEEDEQKKNVRTSYIMSALRRTALPMEARRPS